LDIHRLIHICILVQFYHSPLLMFCIFFTFWHSPLLLDPNSCCKILSSFVPHCLNIVKYMMYIPSLSRFSWLLYVVEFHRKLIVWNYVQFLGFHEFFRIIMNISWHVDLLPLNSCRVVQRFNRSISSIYLHFQTNCLLSKTFLNALRLV